jgi:hypothetical protein
VDPFLDKFAIYDPAEELAFRVDLLAGLRHSLPRSTMGAAQRPPSLNRVTFRDLSLDSQIEAI